MEESKPVLQN
jgi:hypothetical protein